MNWNKKNKFNENLLSFLKNIYIKFPILQTIKEILAYANKFKKLYTPKRALRTRKLFAHASVVLLNQMP